MTQISELEPHNVWKVFEQITKIPRPSSHEEKIRDWLIHWSKDHNFDYKIDDYGNLVIYAPATPGFENIEPVVLQGHMDMVCESNSNAERDCKTEGVDAFVDNEYVTAKDTTLGADNGIGVAIGLGILIDKFDHGPLELLLTREEEIGLFGAMNLDASLIHGKNMINLDSEDWGTITVGCAGGGDSIIEKKYDTISESGTKISIKTGPLKGGHSGVDIHKHIPNANKILSRILYEISSNIKTKLISFNGGNLRNAIPREAELIISTDDKKAKDIFNRVKSELDTEWADIDNLNLTFTVSNGEFNALNIKDTLTLSRILINTPHGVIRFSPVIKDLVETSTNFAKIELNNGELKIQYSTRSSVMSALENTRNQINALYSLIDAKITEDTAYPGWHPNLNTDWFKLVRDKYAEVLGHDPIVSAIHAGLETGAIGGKINGMKMVAIGPTIYGAHSPDERVKIDTVDKIYSLVKDIITEFTKNK